VFTDRRDAGRRLADYLTRRLGDAADAVVLGVSRGGVPVADEVARALGLPFDVVAVRKLELPGASGVVLGAVAEQRVAHLDEVVVRAAGLGPCEVHDLVTRGHAELDRSVRGYRAARPAEPVAGRRVVVVDDGLASGRTAVAACQALARRGAGPVVLALPVAPLRVVHELGGVADAVATLWTPRTLTAVGDWYADYPAVTDDDVVRVLADAGERSLPERPPAVPVARRRPVPLVAPGEAGVVPLRAGNVTLHGDLVSPADADGLVVLAYATAGARHQPETRTLAVRLEAAGVASLQVDLLTVTERAWPRNVDDTDLLARRLRASVDAVRDAYRWVALVGAGPTTGPVMRVAREPDADVAAVLLLGATPWDEETTAAAAAMRTPPVLTVPAPGDPAWGDDQIDTLLFRVCGWLVRRGAESERTG
jgi:putative phosphoribosyl transferase